MFRTTNVVAVAGLLVCLFGAAYVMSPIASVAGHGKHKNKRVRGSGEVVEKKLDVADFERIRLNAVAEIDITVGRGFDVTLEGEDNIVDLYEVRVSGETLEIDMDDGYSIDTDEDVRITIEMPSLDGIEIRGVGDIRASGIGATDFEIDCPGVGNVSCKGKTQRLDVRFSGVGSMDLEGLVAGDARVRVDGVGKVSVYAEDKLDVDVTGMGKVRYFGEPNDVRSRVSGFGRISRGK